MHYTYYWILYSERFDNMAPSLLIYSLSMYMKNRTYLLYRFMAKIPGDWDCE